jgi:hypothetical protein
LGEWEPEIPDGIANRTADNWWILLAIAEVIEDEVPAGSPHPDFVGLTRTAAISAGKSSKVNRTDSNIRLTLLADLKEIFDTEWARDQHPDNPRRKFDKAIEVALFSEDIVEHLHGLEERPWSEWGRAPKKPISVTQLARLLAPLDIRPKNIRFGDKQAKGYERAQFEHAWKIYL